MQSWKAGHDPNIFFKFWNWCSITYLTNDVHDKIYFLSLLIRTLATVKMNGLLNLEYVSLKCFSLIQCRESIHFYDERTTIFWVIDTLFGICNGVTEVPDHHFDSKFPLSLYIFLSWYSCNYRNNFEDDWEENQFKIPIGRLLDFGSSPVGHCCCWTTPFDCFIIFSTTTVAESIVIIITTTTAIAVMYIILLFIIILL